MARAVAFKAKEKEVKTKGRKIFVHNVSKKATYEDFQATVDKFGKVTYFGISVLMIFTIYNYSKFIQKFFESYESYKKIWIPMAFQNWNQSDIYI